MDYKKYYKEDINGCYSLHFLNTNALSPNEIKEIFSRFGKVVAVNVTASERGLRFVRYKTLDEVINCLEGLKDNNKIVILPEKKDYQTKGMNKYSNSKQEIGNSDKQSNGSFMYNKKFSETKFQKEKSTYNTKTFNCDNGIDNDIDTDFLSTGFRRSSHGSKYVNEVTEVEAYDKQDVSEEKHLSFRKRNFNDNSSNDKINYEKYYRILKDKSYMIHFANKKKLSEEEITKIFSEYGTVSSVYAGGDNNGLRFVRYKNLDHIINCLKGLQNNNLINILPQKDKILQADQKENQRQITLNLSQKMHNEKQPSFNSTCSSDEIILETVRKQTHNINNIKTSDLDNRSNDSFDFESPKASYKPDINTIKCEKPRPLTLKTRLLSSTKIDGNTYINKNISDDNRTPMLNFDTEIMQKESDALSDCSLLSKDSSSKIKIIPLQEVIVANIPADYSIHYILHLFENYDPIAATFMKVISEINIQYCIVYFKTVEDSIAIEEEFDNYVLSGMNLIVLRQSKLTENVINK